MKTLSSQGQERKFEIIANNNDSPFMHFLGRELQQIYMLEMKTNQLIAKLLRNVVYQPLRSAMVNYQNVTKEHLNRLRKLGLKSSLVSKENKKASELLMIPLVEQINKNSDSEPLIDIAMLTGIQRIIFYQMAVYRSLCTAAKKLCNLAWAESFDAIINDKKINDSIFSEIALSGIYQDALDE